MVLNRFTAALLTATLLPLAAQQGKDEPLPIPPDLLLEDPHVREEAAVNEFTAPSIVKIFDSLDKLAPLPLADHERKLPPQTPINRADIAVELGYQIAEGFLIVQAERFDSIEGLAGDLTRYGDALGAGKRVIQHAAALLASAREKDVAGLRKELSNTQKDVERDLLALRDADAAHLISLGGWLRALEVSSGAVERQFGVERAEQLLREDIADYYSSIVGSLEPRIAERPSYVEMRDLLSGLRTAMILEEGEEPTHEQVREISKQAKRLVELALTRDDNP